MDGANALEILHSLTAKQHALRPAALRTLTRIHTHTDQSQEALRLSDTLVKEYPDTSFEAYGLLAQFYIHFDRRRFAQAEQALSILWQKYSETEKESIETLLPDTLDWLEWRRYKGHQNRPVEIEHVLQQTQTQLE